MKPWQQLLAILLGIPLVAIALYLGTRLCTSAYFKSKIEYHTWFSEKKKKEKV